MPTQFVENDRSYINSDLQYAQSTLRKRDRIDNSNSIRNNTSPARSGVENGRSPPVR